MAKKTNGDDRSQDAGTTSDEANAGPSPEQISELIALRERVHKGFGQVVLSAAALPRYRNLPIGDLTSLFMEPMLRDRIAIAQTTPKDEPDLRTATGIAIWASVSETVDEKIRDQIKAGVFPVRLAPDDWNSGKINWLLDLIAPNQKMATSVLANFKSVIDQGQLRIHPAVVRMVDADFLKKMGAVPTEEAAEPAS